VTGAPQLADDQGDESHSKNCDFNYNSKCTLGEGEMIEDTMPRASVLREAMERSKKPDQPMAEILTVAEACSYLRISKWVLYRMIHTKQLRSVKIGRRRLIPMRSIREFIEQLAAAEAGG
jgi:excisionase family DNA binding protein